jgi:tetratricopeptide (TPR) repeat protein
VWRALGFPTRPALHRRRIYPAPILSGKTTCGEDGLTRGPTLGDREGAFQSLAQAFELQANGTGDPLEAARYQELLGTLERDCGNFEAAARLLKKALAKTRRWGDPYTLQRVLLATAVNELYRDRFEAAERYLDESLKVKQPDNLFMSYAAVNTILVRYFSGNPHRAYKSLLRVQDGMGQSWLQELPQAKQMSVLWTEGQILNSLRLNDDAVVRLKRAREFFIQAAQGSRVGQISIEIALGYAARQRHADVRRELALGLQFCSERSALDRHAKEALLLLSASSRTPGPPGRRTDPPHRIPAGAPSPGTPEDLGPAPVRRRPALKTRNERA